MRGFILNLRKHSDEDIIVTVLCPDRMVDLYRFYGARHSVLSLGYKIDFVIENNQTFIPRIRQIAHLSFDWLFEIEKVSVWQSFMQLLFKHLRGTETIDEFYFDLLENAAKKIAVQNAKRTIIEACVELLEYEGRLHSDLHCLVCEKPIEDDQIALTKAFFPSHIGCSHQQSFAKPALLRLFSTKESLIFNDFDIARLWQIAEEGL
jgi:recombinational DNA repair protein (RecF pathway)